MSGRVVAKDNLKRRIDQALGRDTVDLVIERTRFWQVVETLEVGARRFGICVFDPPSSQYVATRSLLMPNASREEDELSRCVMKRCVT